jgi:hypothetical protein
MAELAELQQLILPQFLWPQYQGHPADPAPAHRAADILPAVLAVQAHLAVPAEQLALVVPPLQTRVRAAEAEADIKYIPVTVAEPADTRKH